MDTPVAFFIFNRPQFTERAFDIIARVRPSELLVIADGPRHAEETNLCEMARAVVGRVSWPCNVRTNYADMNLGCRQRLSSGLDWVFDQCEEAIILEDDCVPHPTFFRFCCELLDTYRSDERVMMISGDNFRYPGSRMPYSYCFSRYTHVWGWATWRRAWLHYDVDMKLWPRVRDTESYRTCFPAGRRAFGYWRRIFDRVYQGDIDTWDYQWAFACWIQRGLSIVPEVNLVSNIGFGPNATHTTYNRWFAQLPIHSIDFPLRHPPFVIRNGHHDAFTQTVVLGTGGYVPRAIHKLARTLRRVRI